MRREERKSASVLAGIKDVSEAAVSDVSKYKSLA